MKLRRKFVRKLHQKFGPVCPDTCQNLHAQTLAHTNTLKGGDKIVWFSIKYTNHVYVHMSRMNLCVRVFVCVRCVHLFHARAWWRSKWNVAVGELCYCESDMCDRARLYYYYYLNEGKTRKGLKIRVEKKKMYEKNIKEKWERVRNTLNSWIL